MDDIISRENLRKRLGDFPGPVLIDVRSATSYRTAETAIVTAIRRDPANVAEWAPDLEIGRAVVVYCDDGTISATAAEALRHNGFAAAYLDGGFAAWSAARLATAAKPAAVTLWVTRERPKVDRIACPWLIRRFIDRDARFLYVPTAEVHTVAARTGAVPFDVPDVEFGHIGDRCSFDAFIRRYRLEDSALDRLAEIVRGADTGRPELTPQSPGLLALSAGLSAVFTDDQRQLRHGLIVYDALYAWCRMQTAAAR